MATATSGRGLHSTNKLGGGGQCRYDDEGVNTKDGNPEERIKSQNRYIPDRLYVYQTTKEKELAYGKTDLQWVVKTISGYVI